MTRGIADFGALYRAYAPDVLRFALHLSANRSEAEDITSETFVRAWAAADRIETATVKGYLFTIARRLYLELVRTQARHAALDDALPDRGAAPDAVAEARSELAAVHARLQRLPEVDRTAVLLRVVDGLPYDEIARVLGISLAAAKVKVHRARLALAGPP